MYWRLVDKRLYGKKKRYIKIHLEVDVKAKETVAMKVATDDIHDSEVLPNLITDASEHRLISEAYMDGAYDSSKIYTLAQKDGHKACY